MNKTSYKVAFIGTHGVGKSTASYYLTSLLKQNNPTKSVICLEENVRKIAKLTNGKLDDPKFPALAISDQLFRELHNELLYDIIITDRSLIDYVVYAYGNDLSVLGIYYDLSLEHMKDFDKIYFIRPDHNASKIVDDGFRDTNKVFRNKIDEIFHFELNRNKIDYKELKTSEILSYNYLKDLNAI